MVIDTHTYTHTDRSHIDGTGHYYYYYYCYYFYVVRRSISESKTDRSINADTVAIKANATDTLTYRKLIVLAQS